MIFVFLTLKHNEAYLEAGISLDEQDGENSDEFEPWALPGHQDLGPNCSGKICTIFYNWVSLYLIVEIPAFYHCSYKGLLEFCTLTEMGGLGKVKRDALFFVKIILLLGFLYFFICSLDFLRTVFRLLGGKTASEAFASNKILSIIEDFIGCKRFASSFSTQQSEDRSQKIQGADEKVQKSKEEDDFNKKQGVAFNLS